MSVKQKSSLGCFRARDILCQFFGIFILLFFPKLAKADSLEDAARTLARRAAASVHGAGVTCEMRNLSLLDGTEFAKISAAFEEELQQRGGKIVGADASAAVILSVTQNPSEYLGVVQIRRKEDAQTLMETLGPVKGPAAAELAFSVTLHRELLFAQDSPVLDVVFVGDGQVMLALGPAEIDSYQRRDGNWVRSGVEPLPRRKAPERNEHGYLFLGTDSETVSFSSELCSISASGAGWKCEATRGEQTPVRAVSDADLAGKRIGRWLSAAKFEAGATSRIIFTGADGLARVYADGAEPVANFAGWGSEIASVHSGCGGGNGWQLLRTGAGDWTTVDKIDAVEIKEQRAVAVSSAVEFPGGIIALHTPGKRASESAATDDKAIAVDWNLQTGRYEVYQLSVICAD